MQYKYTHHGDLSQALNDACGSASFCEAWSAVLVGGMVFGSTPAIKINTHFSRILGKTKRGDRGIHNSMNPFKKVHKYGCIWNTKGNPRHVGDNEGSTLGAITDTTFT